MHNNDCFLAFILLEHLITVHFKATKSPAGIPEHTVHLLLSCGPPQNRTRCFSLKYTHTALTSLSSVNELNSVYRATFAFTFMHLADTFIQSDLQCIQAIHFFYQYVCSLGIEPMTFCAANAMLYH